jgi:hypothetical protein
MQNTQDRGDEDTMWPTGHESAATDAPQPQSGGRMQPAAQAVGGKQRGRASPGGAKENWAALKYS